MYFCICNVLQNVYAIDTQYFNEKPTIQYCIIKTSELRDRKP